MKKLLLSALILSSAGVSFVANAVREVTLAETSADNVSVGDLCVELKTAIDAGNADAAKSSLDLLKGALDGSLKGNLPTIHLVLGRLFKTKHAQLFKHNSGNKADMLNSSLDVLSRALSGDDVDMEFVKGQLDFLVSIEAGFNGFLKNAPKKKLVVVAEEAAPVAAKGSSWLWTTAKWSSVPVAAGLVALFASKR